MKKKSHNFYHQKYLVFLFSAMFLLISSTSAAFQHIEIKCKQKIKQILNCSQKKNQKTKNKREISIRTTRLTRFRCQYFETTHPFTKAWFIKVNKTAFQLCPLLCTQCPKLWKPRFLFTKKHSTLLLKELKKKK